MTDQGREMPSWLESDEWALIVEAGPGNWGAINKAILLITRRTSMTPLEARLRIEKTVGWKRA